MSDMEEGELSDQENVDFPLPDPSHVAEHGGRAGIAARRKGPPRFGEKFGLQVTFQNPDLPDLVRSVDDGGLSGLDRNVTERMEARAKRFNLNSSGKAFSFDDFIELYQSLGVPQEEYEGNKEKSQRQFRLEALHVRGIEKMVAEDVYNYFKEFNPVSFEWVDSKSANVIWALASSSAKAILSLSRPLLERDEEAMEVNERVSEEEEREEGEEREKKTLTTEDILKRFDENLSIYSDEIPCSLPGGSWRIGKPCPPATTIFMRIANVADQAESLVPEGELFMRNQKLRQEGGVISASRKRKLQEVVMYDREAFEESERQKKYNGPVGKNPWGSIAQEWASGPKIRDFAEELQLFASQRGIGISGKVIRGGPAGETTRRDIHSRLGGINVIKDWDAPEEALDPIAASLHRRSERSPSPLGEPVLDSSDDDAKWNKKLKRPRMTMVADEVQTKTSAKARLFKGLKRKVDNSTKIEIFEEEEEDNGLEEKESEEIDREDGLDLRMTINANNDELNPESSKRMNERFHGKAGRGSVLARLGRRESGDSLERDTGEDLRGELDGRHAANMVIHVAQSDHEEEQLKQDEDIAEERIVRKARPASTIQRPIKQEKDLVPLQRRHQPKEESKVERKEASPPQVDRKDVREKIREKERETLSRRREQTRETVRQRATERRRDDHGSSRDKRVETVAEVRRQTSAPSRDLIASSKNLPASKDSRKKSKSAHPGKVKVKKEKLTDDEASSEDTSSSSSSSSSSEDDDSSGSSSDSSDSDSSDDSSDSSSSSSSSDSESDGKRKGSKKKPVVSKRKAESSSARDRAANASASGDRRKREELKDRQRTDKGRGELAKRGDKKKAGDGKKLSVSSSKDSKGLKDKLTEYLKQAKEKKKRAGKK